MKKILIGILVLFILMQFFRIDTTNPQVNPENDFFAVVKADPATQKLIKNSCYDCHSDQTVYPWYAQIAPVSWMIKHHVEEGREHVNFSTYATYNSDQKKHITEECVEVLEHKEMPMAGYVLMHPEAKLTEEQNQKLIQFFKQIK